MNSTSCCARVDKPEKPIHDANANCWIYKDHRLSDDASRLGAQQQAELLYLRDLALYYEQELRSYMAWERYINECLNSGDGSYRP